METNSTEYIEGVNSNQIVLSVLQEQFPGLTQLPSAAEAEYVALTETGRDVVWIRRLLSDLSVAPTAPTLLHEDNAAALKWTVEARNWNRSRHIDTAFHKIREWIDDKLIAVQKVDSANQLADLFTKALKPVDHARLASLILGSADVCAADNVRRNIFTQPAFSQCKAQLTCSYIKPAAPHTRSQIRRVNPAA